MEEYDLEPVIEAINRVYDNIWLGDLEAAKEFAESNLEKIRAQLDLSELEKTATKLRNFIQKMRKSAREKGIKNRRLWVADRLSKEMEKEELDPIKNIFGVLTIHLSSLNEAVSYLIKAQAQRTIESFAEKNLEEERVFRRSERYRYAIQRLPDRWEVRAVLDTPAKAWDLRKLRDRLVNYDLSIAEVSKKAFSNIFELYSRDMYIRVLGQEKLVEILIHTPATKDVEKRVSKVVEAIINSLTI